MILHSNAPNLCPLCSATLSNAMMGVTSHLRSHMRKGEIKKTAIKAMRRFILGRASKEVR